MPLLIALVVGPSLARERPFVDEPSMERPDIGEVAPWSETGITLPAYPLDIDLVEFSVDDPGSLFRYFIDLKSLSVGDTGSVVRYTLVIQAPSGSRNVSFEGLRCDTQEHKIYAFGTGQGQFRPLKAPQWMRIRSSGSDRPYRDLREFYFCQPSPRYRPYEAVEILRRLRITPRYSPNSDLLGVITNERR